MSTIDAIPPHLHRALSDSKNISLLEVMKVLVTHVALECGFVSNNLSIHNYSYTWFYSFDKMVFEDCTFKSLNSSQDMAFMFVMDREQGGIIVKCHEVGDLVIVSAYEDNSKNVIHCESLAIPVSRYIPFKKLITPLTSSFRNLKELSFKLKQNIFHPLRNKIYYRNQQTSPWLNGMPEFILEKIHKLLSKKDRQNLRRVCKTQHQILPK